MQSQLQLFDKQLHFMNLLYPELFQPVSQDHKDDLKDLADSDLFKGDNHSQPTVHGN